MRLLLYIPFLLFSFKAHAFENKSAFLDFSIQESNFVDTIGFEFKKGQIIIPVTCEGKVYHFCLDTGSGCGVLNATTNITYVATGTVAKNNDANNVSSMSKIVKLENIQLGKLHIANYPLLLNEKQDFSCLNDGLIGFNLLRKGLKMKIDIQKRHIILTDQPKMFANESGQAVKYISYDVPLVTFKVSFGLKDYAIFDTGSSVLFSMNKTTIYDGSKLPKRNKGYRAFLSQTIWSDSGYGSISLSGAQYDSCFFMKLQQLNVLGVCLRDVPSQTSNGFCSIGVKILKYGSIVIDPFKQKMLFQPYENNTTIDVNEAPTNISVGFKDGQCFISMINPNSDIYKQGGRKGDRIKTLNGDEITDVCSFLGAYYADIELRSVVVVNHEGREKTIVIKGNQVRKASSIASE